MRRDALLLAGAAVGAVAAWTLLRPGLAARVAYLDLLEWGAVALAVVAVAFHARARAARDGAEEPWSSRLRRHAPETRARLDPAYEAWSRASRAFLDRGERRAEYEALWTAAFQTLTRRPETVRKALEPLAALREEPGPRVFKPPWVMRRVEEENRRRRREVHRTLLARWRAARNLRARVRR